MDVKTQRNVNVTVHLRLETILLLTFLLTILASFIWMSHQATAATPSEMPLASSQDDRSYYLALAVIDATHALDACVDGYHMASLWELLDTSNLIYNDAIGIYKTDSGEGPPSGYQGWVRTGYGGDHGTTAGRANCDAWTTTSGDGTAVALPSDWISGSKDVHVWTVTTSDCGNPSYVWCVGD